ncbi:MAG TPA: hypothetical protein VL326_36545 [Kofleriaceae bacterium]|nr:hypothetical protein [Kofleriaceae bacterium]
MPPAPAAFKVNYNLKPLAALVGLVVAGAGGGFWYYKHRAERTRFEHDFPCKLTPSERHVLEVEGGAWVKGKPRLLAALAAFDPAQADARVTAERCTLRFDPISQGDVDAANTDRSRTDGSFGEMVANLNDPDADAGRRLEVGPDLVERAREKLAAIERVRSRKRFRTIQVRDKVIQALEDPAVIIVKLDVDVSPELTSLQTFTPGVREGHVYALDRETGELRCAGAFHAESTDNVSALASMTGYGNQAEALHRDLDAQMERAIAGSLRTVR